MQSSMSHKRSLTPDLASEVSSDSVSIEEPTLALQNSKNFTSVRAPEPRPFRVSPTKQMY